MMLSLPKTISQAKQFWYLRENIPEALRKTGHSIHFDISLPLDRLADFLIKTEPRIKTVAPDILLVPFGHIGDGNLHYNMCYLTVSCDFGDLKKQIEEMVIGEVTSRKGRQYQR